LTEPITREQEHLLTEEMAATKCGVSRLTFRRWVVARCIEPVLEPGSERHKLYRREDVELFARSL
jgi:hypothetical protein